MVKFHDKGNVVLRKQLNRLTYNIKIEFVLYKCLDYKYSIMASIW